jgi:hypothetical protein
MVSAERGISSGRSRRTWLNRRVSFRIHRKVLKSLAEIPTVTFLPVENFFPGEKLNRRVAHRTVNTLHKRRKNFGKKTLCIFRNRPSFVNYALLIYVFFTRLSSYNNPVET